MSTNISNKISRDFTMIPNGLINEVDLHPVARFIFVYLASKPADWEYFNSQLCKAMGIHIDTLRKYMKELQQFGWIEVIQKRGEDGSFSSNCIDLKPYPFFTDTVNLPNTEKPDTVKNGRGKNHALNNTDIITNTNLKNKNKKASSPKFDISDFKKFFLSHGVNEQHLVDWISARKAKRAVCTLTVCNSFISKSEKYNLEISFMIEKCAEFSWLDFKPEWLENKEQNSSSKQESKVLSSKNFNR